MSEFNQDNGSLSSIEQLLSIDEDTADSTQRHHESRNQLESDSLLLSKHTLVTSPWSRLGIIAVPFGLGFLAIFLLLNGVFNPQQPDSKTTQKHEDKSEITEQAQVNDDDGGKARAKLALSEQANELGKINDKNRDNKPIPVAKTEKVVPSRPLTPRPVTPTSVRPVQRPSPRQKGQALDIRTNPTRQPSRSYSPKPSVTRQLTPIDPTDQLNKLRSIGSYGNIAYADIKPSSILDPAQRNQTASIPTGQNEQTDNVDNRNINQTTQENTSNTIEKIRPRWLVTKNTKSGKYLDQESQIFKERQTRYLTVGEFAAGILVTPVVKQQDDTPNRKSRQLSLDDRRSIAVTQDLQENYGNSRQLSLDGRRSIAKLTQDLHDNYGNVAIPTGSLLAVEVVSVDAGGYAQMQVTSIIKDNTEYPISEGAISVLGEGGKPIIAKNFQNKGGEIAGYDLTVGLVGGLGKVGEILNQSDSTSTIQNSSIGSSSSSVIQNNRRDIGGAFLQGAFGQLTNIIGNRAKQSTQEILARPNVWYIPELTKVTFIVNRSLELS